MRLPCWGRSTARQPQRLGPQLLALANFGVSLTQAIDFQPVPSPNLDLSDLGRIGVAGDFNGLSLYEFEGQSGGSVGPNGGQSLLAQLPNGALASIVSTDASIRAMCTFMRSNGDMQGVVIGGNFTSLDGTESTAIALFNPDTAEITPLEGLEGQVNAILCDQERDTVYVGGNFRGANSTNAIAWYGTEGWTNLPFAGFNGPVMAITKAPNGHIIFGGSFTGMGNASTPSEPDGQSINLSTANITADNSASTDGFSNPQNIVCSSGADERGNTWLVRDNTPGTWGAEFGFSFLPTKLRLWNTHREDRGTKTFRYIAFPIDGIMNFTYIDPATGRNASCTSECPLSNNRSVEFQDFHFVNQVRMNRFQIAISEWYGAGAGLAGIELFQDNILAHAVRDFNEPTCRGIDFPSNATTTGPWKESPSLQSNSIYLTAEVSPGDDPNSASVVFTPNIRQSGNYSVNMYTPGCAPDDTCETRGRVNITGVMSSGTSEATFTTSLFQTNNYEKYDQIYFGYIEQSSDTFKPTVTLTALAGQDIDNLTIVAQSVGFTLINSTGGLNGLFDFDPEQAVVDSTTFEDSAINKLGATFSRNTGVASLVTSGDLIYVGGNFTSPEHDNIVAINNDNEVLTVGGSLNDEVYDMHLEGNSLFVGGEFTNTKTDSVEGLNFVGLLDTGTREWRALGAGLNGRVEHVVPFHVNISGETPETVIAFSGAFSQCREFGDFEAISVDGLAIWVPSQQNWLQNLGRSVPSYSGILTAALLDLPNGDSLYAGSVASAQLSVSGIATLTEEGLGQFPINIRNLPPSSNLTRRDILSADEISGVVTGKFYEEGDQNLTILAGHFSAQASDGSTVNNLIFVDGNDGDSVTGLGSEISAESTIVTIAISGATLYAGGRIRGTINDVDVNGLVVYDINAKSLGNQIPPVSGAQGTVSAITIRPDTSEVFVGGSFDNAGALDCPGLCVFDANTTQWNRPGNNLAGDVSSLFWSSPTTLLVGGDLRGNDTGNLYLALYDTEAQTSRTFPSAESLPGPVHVIVPASNDENELWVAGTRAGGDEAFVMKYDGERWLTIEPALPNNAVIRSLQVFQVTEGHGDTDTLDDRHVLMLTGEIPIPELGNTAAVIYNGSGYQPYALATSSGNGAGSIAKIFTQRDNFFASDGNHMPIVFVILIGLAVALGLILLLVVGGIVLDRIRKKREGYSPAPTSMIDRGSGIQRIPPHELLESLGQGRPGAPHV
ncbi:Squalestatin S1 biosynthesis cluster protein L1 [Paramyrothecium foliicola]|nr:Squalestatin S1 biosynthesis cluster protein L1 [Paramyrothecium foliicola]